MDLQTLSTLTGQGSWAKRIVLGTALATLLAGGTVVAVASLGEPAPETKKIEPPTMNVDSLYTAMVADVPTADTGSSIEIAPPRVLNGHASWYGPGFHGRKTANGERFDRHEMTAAHKTLPFGTIVRVTDEKTGKSVLVRINDRGPYIGGRLLDLSEGAATRLGIKGRGTGTVRMEVYTPTDLATDVSFDVDGRARLSRGYAVRVARTKDFNEAVNLQYRLGLANHSSVLLTRCVIEGRTEYQVSIGLFTTERLCQSLMAELIEEFEHASIVRFEAGRPVEQTLAEK